MYTSYFGLTERPFSIAPDPQYLYMSSRHKEAMAHLSYGLTHGGCFIVLTGEVGTGKTTLCRNLLSELSDDVDVALILNAKINELELLQTVCDELKIDHQPDFSQKQLLDIINRHLLKTYADNRQTVLIIDEAQLLRRDVLEQVRLLTNLETTKHKLLQIILIGQPELNDLLSRNDLRQLAQRVTARYHLGALAANEIEDYVNYRLGVAGCRQPLFSKQALAKLHVLTGGIPRKINVLADHALLGAYSKSESIVSAQSVKAAAREVFIAASNTSSSTPSIRTSVLRWLSAAAALVLLNVGLWWWFAGQPQNVDQRLTESSLHVQKPMQDATVQKATTPSIDQELVSTLQSLPPDLPIQPEQGVVPSASALESIQNGSPDEQFNNREQSSVSIDPPEEVTPESKLVSEEKQETMSLTSAEQIVKQQRVAETASSLSEITRVIGTARVPGNVVVSQEFLSAEVSPVSIRDTAFSEVLETSSDLTGRISAFRRLSAMWGEQLPSKLIQPACQVLSAKGLNCLGFGTWDELRRYNRPAILVLSHKQQLHRVIVSSLQEQSATILIGQQSYQVPAQELRERWTGNGVLFWKPSGTKPIFLQLGDRSGELPSLRLKINKAFAETRLPLLKSVDSTQFDLDMSQKIFALQTRYAVLQDSKIGNETYLLLNEILQPEATPVLSRRIR